MSAPINNLNGRKVTRAMFSIGVQFGAIVRTGLDSVKDNAEMELCPMGLLITRSTLSKAPVLVPFSHVQNVVLATLEV